jgi:hypothetical protein
MGNRYDDPNHLWAALFTAALLAPRTDLAHGTRSQIIARVPTLDLHSERGISGGLSAAYEGIHLGSRSFRIPHEKSIKSAIRRADDWLARGVFVVPFACSAAADAGLENPPHLLFAWGDGTLLNRPSAAILNSRPPRQVTPDDKWLKQTRFVFLEAFSRYCTMVSSYGTLPYSLVSRMASANGTFLLVVCDGPLPYMQARPRLAEFLRRNAGLFPCGRTLMLSPFPPGKLPDRAVRSRVRDELVAGLASAIFAVHIREGGNMEAILKKAEQRGIPIGFFPPEPGGNHSGSSEHGGEVASQTVARTRAEVLVLSPWPATGTCLVHYTRSCAGPWPGQSLAEYCQSLLDCRRDAGHTAFDTLMRILEERLIRGSSKLTRGRTPLVSFTECLPEELNSLIKWRPGLIRWSFEPYGLVIGKDFLTKLGIRQVVYGGERTFEEMAEEDRFRFQLQRPGGKDWTVEKEWRLEGHLRLDKIASEDITVVVPTLEEARQVADRTAYRVTLAKPREDRMPCTRA